MTHPELTPGHDVKVPRGGVGAKLSSGWQVREDQADPEPVIVPADPRPARPAPAAAVDVPADPRERVAADEPTPEPKPESESELDVEPALEPESDGEAVDDESADTPVDESVPESPALPHHPEES